MPEQESAYKKLIHAYNTMLERVKVALEQAGVDAGPTVKKAIDNAEEKASELDELSREEASKIARYLQRDIHDAAEYLANEGAELAAWAHFDLEQVESRILDTFLSVADRTTLELKALNHEGERLLEWHTGEITSIGTLVCASCGKTLHFHETGHIPPCPACHHTVFKRLEK